MARRVVWYVALNSALRTDGCDPLTLLEVAPAIMPVPESGLESQRSGYAFLMERTVCKSFGVVTYGAHMAVYKQQKGDMAEGGYGRGWARPWG